MEITELKENDLRDFTVLSDHTHESIVYLKNGIVYKIFRRDIDDYEDKAKYDKKDLDNKRKKLLLLDKLDLDERFLKPNSLIYINNEFRGYTMDFASYLTLNNFLFKRKKKKLELLKDARSIVIEAHKNNIILADINLGNFILKNNYLTLGDLDNSKICNYNCDCFKLGIASEYLKTNPVDEKFDWFLFNIMVISMITNIVPSFVLNPNNLKNTVVLKNKELYEFYINLINFNIDLNNKDAIDILESKKKIFKF